MSVKYLYLISMVNVFLCLGLGFFTFSRNARHLSNISFFLGMSCLAIIEAGNAIILIPHHSVEKVLIGMKISLIGQAALVPSWLLFTVVFARAEYWQGLKRWGKAFILFVVASLCFIYLIHSTPFVLISSSYKSSNIDWLTFSNQPLFVFSSYGTYFYIYLIAGSLLSLINLEQTLRSSKGLNRWQIKYIVFGLGAILSLFIYLASQVLLYSSLKLHLISVISVVVLISTLIMCFFIVRHRLLDVDIFISRYIVYNSVTLFVVGIYLLLTGIVAQEIRYLNPSYGYFFSTLFVVLALLILVILLFITKIRRKIQLFINRNFYKHKYEFRDKWMESIDRLTSKSSSNEICRTLLEMVSETMGPKSIYLWLYNPVFKDYRIFDPDGPEKLKVIEKSNVLINQLNLHLQPFFIEDVYEIPDLGEKEIAELDEMKKLTNAVICCPLVAGGEVLGFILQGGDISGEQYRADDFEFLKAVTTQSAIQIKSVQLVTELLSAREVEVFHKMSSFIMHDLKNLTNSLSLISQNAAKNIANPEFQQDTIRTIDNNVIKMKGLIEKFSSVPRGLDLHKRKVSLERIIPEAIKKIAVKDKNVVLTCEIDDIPAINIDPHAVEMVLINLINNAFDAIENKGEIKIVVFKEGNYANIKISDNGKGMSKDFIESSLFKPFKSTKKSGFGIGLYQSKSVIDAHNGILAFTSEEGKGTSFTVKLPIGNELSVVREQEEI